jgi:hypothetical protein
MTTRQSYRDKALECIEAAELMRDPSERAAMLRIAADYMTLAKHVADRQEHGTAAASRRH